MSNLLKVRNYICYDVIGGDIKIIAITRCNVSWLGALPFFSFAGTQDEKVTTLYRPTDICLGPELFQFASEMILTYSDSSLNTR